MRRHYIWNNYFYDKRKMIYENIYFAIFLASFATYFCRASGVYFSKKIKLNSKLFTLISYISIGVIVAIITRIIVFPKGILLDAPNVVRYISILALVLCYYLLNKNVILSTTIACFIFYLSLKLSKSFILF